MKALSFWEKIYVSFLLICFVTNIIVSTFYEKVSNTRLWEYLTEAFWVIMAGVFIVNVILRAAKSPR